MRKLQLGFHTTFPLRKTEVARLINLAASEEELPSSSAELMDRTGFGSKKVGPVKSWTTRSGLIHGQSLTEEGRIVSQFDPSLRSTTTEWLMHFHLSFGARGFAPVPDSPSDWGGWPYLVFQFLPDHPSFTLETLVIASASVFEDDPKVFRANFPYALRAYTEPDALAGCEFITQTPNASYHVGSSTLPPMALVGYLLAKLWERDFGDTQSVLTDSILDQHMGLGPLLGLGRSAVEEVLTAIAGHGFIEQRRTVAPFQVVRRWQRSIEFLLKAYK